MTLPCLLAVALLSRPLAVQAPAGNIDNLLIIGGVIKTGRLPVPVDSVQAAMVDGTWSTPSAGATLTGPDGKPHAWASVQAGKDGWYESDALESGYAFATYNSPRRQVMLVNAQGDSVRYVNGVPRAGDVYSFGYVKTPAVMEPGRNDLLFACLRGRFRVALQEPAKPMFLDASDATLPDVISTNQPYRGALLLVNASESALSNAAIRVKDARFKSGWSWFPVRPVGPLSITKVAFGFAVDKIEVTREGKKFGTVHLELMADGKSVSDQIDLTVDVKTADQPHKVTFLSQIDGSVQYYAVNPASRPADTNALVMSTHGASVEAIGQAQAYASKDWATIVCPANRRPYGFDWEDWGRLDAMEVLGEAGKRFPHDPRRTVLTGHSMGGHGAWHLSTTYPDRFAAVGPSAGWVSFASNGGGYTLPDAPTDAEKVMAKAVNAGNTLNQVRNLGPMGVYILHGSADDNVPLSEARTMRDNLAAFHHGFTLWEEPGAGHWWSNSDEPGAQCVDWPPMFDLFARRAIPSMREVRNVEFHTASPNVSSRDHWLTIEEQHEQFEPTWANLQLDPHLRRFKGTTMNVAALTLNVVGALGDSKPVTVELDGMTLKDLQPGDGKVTLTHGASWVQTGAIPARQKTPRRGSGFKNALRHNWVIVYGTQGTAEEDKWMADKARYDAETFWYRGNASVPVIADTQFSTEMALKRDVMLIGNSTINSVWSKLNGGSPVDVVPGVVKVSGRDYTGDNLVCLYCRPSLGDETMVAFVGVTGAKARRLAERLPYLSSGVAYPDYTVISTDGFTRGTKAVLDAGYFDNNWNFR